MRKVGCCTADRSMSYHVGTILRREKLMAAGLAIILAFLVVGLLAPHLAPSDPTKIDLGKKLLPPFAEYPLGTDYMGRCVLSRLIYGTRASLFNALLVLSITLGISIPVGVAAGYAGGGLDSFIMRIIDILLAFPSLILTLVIAGLLGPGLTHLLIALSVVWWTGYARIIRGMVMQIKEKDFVMAARACGASHLKIVVRHILLNAVKPVIVLATLEVGHIILTISGLSFLGLGAQPPAPEWGVMLNDSRPYMETAPRLMLFPGLAIMLVVMAFNMVGEGLRNAVDHKGRGQ